MTMKGVMRLNVTRYDGVTTPPSLRRCSPECQNRERFPSRATRKNGARVIAHMLVASPLAFPTILTSACQNICYSFAQQRKASSILAMRPRAQSSHAPLSFLMGSASLSRVGLPGSPLRPSSSFQSIMQKN